jgi:hypothetical protein
VALGEDARSYITFNYPLHKLWDNIKARLRNLIGLMSLAKRLYPRAEDSKRRRQFRALQTAVILGLVCSVLMALMLYGVYWMSKKV